MSKKRQYPFEDEEEGRDGDTSGGSTGEIEFHYQDALSTPLRDDLPTEEVKRLLGVHKDSHKDHVDKQKHERKDRANIKDGKPVYSADGRRKGIGGYGPGSGYSQFKAHPISDKAQFSGVIDKKVARLPNQAEIETNEDMKNELKLQNRLTAVPKPSSTPRLER